MCLLVTCQFKRNQRLTKISLEQETLPLLLSNVWFQKRSRLVVVIRIVVLVMMMVAVVEVMMVVVNVVVLMMVEMVMVAEMIKMVVVVVMIKVVVVRNMMVVVVEAISNIRPS